MVHSPSNPDPRQRHERRPSQLLPWRPCSEYTEIQCACLLSSPSHGALTTAQTHAATVEKLRAAAAERPESNLAILLDTKGPEIRTGFLKEHKPIQLTKGQDLTIVTDYDVLGDSSTIACTYQSLPSTVKPGSPILAADGALVMTVKECHADHVVVRVENDCTLGERKNMNLPGAIVDLPTVTEKDTEDLTKFAVPYGVDFIAASFVRKGSDIEVIRKLLGEEGAHIKIIAKIENKEGLENFETILQAADGIMVARGDLGMEIPPGMAIAVSMLAVHRPHPSRARRTSQKRCSWPRSA